MAEITTEKYRSEGLKGIRNRTLQQALVNLQNRFGKGTAEAYRRLPEGPGLRRIAHEIRRQSIDNLDILLERLAEKIHGSGGQVYFAADADAAVAYCLDVALRNQVKRVVKGKSMVSEEMALNTALSAAGIEVCETDLGEYIVQLADEHPSHIIAPAIHKTRQDIGRLFAEKLGVPYEEDPHVLTRMARKALRRKFLTADMGITGCNIACAETGHVTTVSNEGNIRMSSTLPRIHVVIMGMERVTARLEEHDILFRLLTRGAAAQNMATYVSYVGGPRQTEQDDGPEQFHLVILDNGRSKILADPRFREMLYCIRCAACLNVCPVYAKIGGHAYGYPYCGPMGAVFTPLQVGINRARHLCQGETLCGACQDACPVNIDIPRMLLEIRAQLADGDPSWGVVRSNPLEKGAYMIWALIMRNRKLYDAALQGARWMQCLLPRQKGMIRRLPPPLNGWTGCRDLSPLAAKSFKQRWKEAAK
jgi:L-lactate dehydrogenase complex protein LldF